MENPDLSKQGKEAREINSPEINESYFHISSPRPPYTTKLEVHAGSVRGNSGEVDYKLSSQVIVFWQGNPGSRSGSACQGKQGKTTRFDPGEYYVGKEGTEGGSMRYLDDRSSSVMPRAAKRATSESGVSFALSSSLLEHDTAPNLIHELLVRQIEYSDGPKQEFLGR